jgi:uncharacterized protein involved in outer membrane biogenesis
MMNKRIKYIAFALGGLIVLTLIVAGILAATFNPNDYKPLIVKLVQEKKQRTLNIEGDIKLAFWPSIGADLGKISLSEHKSDKQFASVEGLKVSLALLPLLKKELIVDTIYLDGARANIVRYEDGTTNLDDLLSKDETESEQIKFDIDGVIVTNSAVNFTDKQAGSEYALSKFNLKTGRVALAQPFDLDSNFDLVASKPELKISADIQGNFMADPEAKHFVVKSLNANIKGDLAGGKDVVVKLAGDIDAKPENTELLVDGLKVAITGSFSGAKLAADLAAPKLTILRDEVSGKEAKLSLTHEKGSDTFKANLVLADIKGSPKAIQSSGISGDIAAKQGARSVQGKFSSPFSGNLEQMIFELPKLAGNLDVKDPALPKGAMQGTFALKLHTDVKQEQVSSDFNLAIDNTRLNGDLAVAGFAKPDIKFNLTADTLDLNKLLGKADSSQSKAAEPAGKPADLSALKDLLLDGRVNIGSVLYDKYKVSSLALTVKADGQKLSVNPLSLKLDESQIKGSFAISQFARPLYTFDIDIDRIDADRYVGDSSGAKASTGKAADNKPLDLSALKALNANGSLRIGALKYGKIQSSNIRIDLRADGEKLNLSPLAAKVDDSQIQASIGITRFANPVFNFAVNIDKLDADRYITSSENAQATAITKPAAETPLDLSALKKFNASGDANIGWLKLANVKTSNVKLRLNADNGVVDLAPFSANLYEGSMAGSLKVDARNVPAIAFKQDMKNITIGPLLVDAINNNMLNGKGNLSIDVTTQGATVGALKKGLNGKAATNLADGSVKGIDIAGTLRGYQNKLNTLKGETNVEGDMNKKTDFSEMSATFNIKNGVARNDDLNMKAPLFRITGSGDIDIGNERINYLAKPAVVATLKGQSGAGLEELSGITIPVKLTGTFSKPSYALDFAGIATALAQKKVLEKVGGSKGEAVQKLIGGDTAGGLESLLGGNKKKTIPAPENDAKTTSQEAAPDTAPEAVEEKPQTVEEKAKQKLNKLLGL